MHNYERTCPIYQNTCTNNEQRFYKGALNGTIHVVAGGGGAGLTYFANISTLWSVFKDFDYGISRDYRDIMGCAPDSCPTTTLAS
nr:probable inactive purple acid phosphatase 1 [Ipomoea trifida]